MRIVFKLKRLWLGLAVSVLSQAVAGFAVAAEAPAVSSANAPSLSSPTNNSPANNQIVVASAAGAVTTNTNGSPLPPPPLPGITADPKGAGTDAALNNLENKAPESVKEVVKHLNKATDDVTLDDLNSARQAVAKIEALIEIEKHLTELDKVRQERTKGAALATVIPASALQPRVQTPAFQSDQAPLPMPAPEKALEVSRVMGRSGHYSAMIKMSDDKTRTVQVGDHLPDGSVVIAIMATGVEFERNGSRHSISVKNVDTVFGNSF